MPEGVEVGQGWSKQEVEKTSKGAVYLRHLEGIRGLVEKHGKNMQFWSDVLLEDPKNAKLLDKHASPIIWGYEPSHPYEEQAKVIAECGLKFCLAPGNATWRSFTGRWSTARDNIAHAVETARQYKAEGILLTSWGDCGNHQPWSTQYPGILYGAQMAWAGSSLPEEKLGADMDRLVFGNPNSGLGKVLLEIGWLDEIMASNIPNSSLHWWILFPSRENWLQSFLIEKTSLENLNQGITHLCKCSEMLGRIESSSDLSIPFKELELGLEMTRISLERGVKILEGKNHEKIDATALVEKFESVWKVRARSGGLKEASNLLAKALS